MLRGLLLIFFGWVGFKNNIATFILTANLLLSPWCPAVWGLLSFDNTASSHPPELLLWCYVNCHFFSKVQPPNLSMVILSITNTLGHIILALSHSGQIGSSQFLYGTNAGILVYLLLKDLEWNVCQLYNYIFNLFLKDDATSVNYCSLPYILYARTNLIQLETLLLNKFIEDSLKIKFVLFSKVS